MYIVGANQLARPILALYAIIIVAVFSWGGFPDSFVAAARTVGWVTTAYFLVLTALFGSSAYLSPWRMLWRTFPALNEWIYPDLNGVWLGSTRSNWPVISAAREAARTGRQIDLEALRDVPLQENEIAMQIRASFLWITVRSQLQSTNADSQTTFAHAERDPRSHVLSLAYVYRQQTPEPLVTDEDSHIGAATLEVSPGSYSVMSGHYWTRRKWREGMNTAGRLEVKRVSEHHANATDNLLDTARRLAKR